MRYGWLIPFLYIAASGVAEATPARYVTFGEIYKARESKHELTPEQSTYVLAVIATLSRANDFSWSRHGRGLYCLPDRQQLTQEFVLMVVDNELRSDRGWAYSVNEPVSKIIVYGLLSQYPCTDNEVERVKKQDRQLLDSLLDAQAAESKPIALPKLISAFMLPPGTSPEWSMGATPETPEVEWQSVGVETSCGSFASCRRGSARVSVAGKELQNLRQRPQPVTWEIFMASSMPAKFGPEQVHISPSCDTVSCEFDFEKGMARSGIALKRLCHAGPASFRQTAYRLSKGKMSVIAIVNDSLGSGGASTTLTLHLASATDQQDWCAEARAMQ